MLHRRIFAALAALCFVLLPGHAWAQKTKAAITTEINTTMPTGCGGCVTALIVRSALLDIVNSYLDYNGGSTFSCSAHQWVSSGALSSFTCTQPAASDITGLGAPATLNIGTGLSSGGGNLNIANTIVAGGPTGSATVAPILTYNAQGQLSVVSSATITPAFSSLTGTPTTLAGYGIASPLPGAQGGTNCTVASGTCLDNITGFAGTGFIVRNGGGSYSFQSGGTFLNVKNAPFNAVCNNVADDTTALQAAINAAEAASPASATVYIPGGSTCKITTALSVTSPITILGDGFSTSILVPATTIDGIDVNTTSAVRFVGFGINYPSAATVGTSGIAVTATGNVNSSSIFRDLQILNAAQGINFIRAQTFDVHNVKISLFVTSAIVVQNLNNADQGDSTIEASYFQGLNTTTTTACVQWTSSGGLRFANNKCVTATNGLAIQLLSAAVTAQMIIEGNSFDTLGASGSAMSFVRSGATGTFGRLLIVGNICNGVLICVQVPTDANGAWLSNVAINSNLYIGLNSAAAIAFTINSISGALLMNGNVLQSQNAATIGLQIGAAVTGCTIYNFQRLGTFAADSFGSTCDGTEPPWVSFAPSPSCGTATFTVNSAKRKILGKQTSIQADITITAIGTCTNALTFTMPNVANSAGGMVGRDLVVNGAMVGCAVAVGASSMQCTLSAGSGNFVVNQRLTMSGVYENQ